MPRDAAPRPAPGVASEPTVASSEARSRRRRTRLSVAVASAAAVAFVVTVAVVASSPAPRPQEDAVAPPVAGPTEAPPGSPTPTPTFEPAVEPEPTPQELPGEPDPAVEVPERAPAADLTAPPAAEAPPERTAPTSPVERSPAPNDDGGRLWGRWFSADRLQQDREVVIVAGDRPLYIGALRQEGGDRLVWMTSCNTFGGELTVRRDRLLVRDIGGTAVDCDDEFLEAQEEWLLDFFAARPNWRSLGGRLRLWTPDGRRIDLLEDREGPGPPWS